MTTTTKGYEAFSATSPRVLLDALKAGGEDIRASYPGHTDEDVVTTAFPGLDWQAARNNFPAMVRGIVVSDADRDDALTAVTLSAMNGNGETGERTVWRDDNGAIALPCKSGGERFRLRGDDLTAGTGPVGFLILTAARQARADKSTASVGAAVRLGAPAPAAPTAAVATAARGPKRAGNVLGS